MESYRIEFARSARKDFTRIPKSDAERILRRIERLSEDPRPLGCKKLANDDSYRIRIGTYRVVYDLRDQVLFVLILRVGHRKDIYKR